MLELLHIENIAIIEEADIRFEPGFNALTGETGAGKTPTALAIMGLVACPPGRIERGSIVFDGQDLSRLSKHEYRKLRGKEISMIFQDPMSTLNPVYTVGSQILENLKQHEKLSRQERQSCQPSAAAAIRNAPLRSCRSRILRPHRASVRVRAYS